MYFLPFLFALLAISCEQGVEHTAPAISDKDSVALMVTYGVKSKQKSVAMDIPERIVS